VLELNKMWNITWDLETPKMNVLWQSFGQNGSLLWDYSSLKGTFLPFVVKMDVASKEEISFSILLTLVSIIFIRAKQLWRFYLCFWKYPLVCVTVTYKLLILQLVSLLHSSILILKYVYFLFSLTSQSHLKWFRKYN
jgi:hypothetical protein